MRRSESLLTIVGADEAARENVRRRLPSGAVGTVALLRGREDWRRLNRLDSAGPVVLLVFDRAYADVESGGWPTFHVEDLTAASAYLLAMQGWRESAASLEEDAW